MSTGITRHIVLCNQAKRPKVRGDILRLDYLKKIGTIPTVRIGLPDFVRGVYHLSPRILDLLEIACYVFASDRKISRGSNDAVEFQAWARDIHCEIRVRDISFWNDEKTKSLMSELLTFMTGDAQWTFNFQPGHETEQADLFDREEFLINVDKPTKVVLFSGGLDSLTGAISCLEKTNDQVCLVSHRSGHPETHKTQRGLYGALTSKYGDRVKHYSFNTSLQKERSVDENQRSRSFLFGSIAFALACAYQQNEFYIFENGVTSINLPQREDMINARSSRTTHPKTLKLLEAFFTHINSKSFSVQSPYFSKTKTDVLTELKSLNGQTFVSSSVSCSKAFKHFENATHCGICYQCTDRRFAVFASDLFEYDNRGLYTKDFVTESIDTAEAKIGVIDYLRQSCGYSTISLDSFSDKYSRELFDIVDCIDGQNDEIKIETVWSLCKRHGEQVIKSLKMMRSLHDNVMEHPQKDSLLKIIDERIYLKPDVERLMDDLIILFRKSIPIIYQHVLPQHENDLNDKVEGLLNSESDKFYREYPGIPFALAKTIPDHSSTNQQLYIESKYVKEKGRLSKLTDEIAADLGKYPPDVNILFFIYDPVRAIHKDEIFSSDFEQRDKRCRVAIIR